MKTNRKRPKYNRLKVWLVYYTDSIEGRYDIGKRVAFDCTYPLVKYPNVNKNPHRIMCATI